MSRANSQANTVNAKTHFLLSTALLARINQPFIHLHSLHTLMSKKKGKKTKRSETPRLFWGDCSVVLKNPSSRVWLISLSALTAVRLQQMGWQSASWHNASLRKFLETDWERSWGVKVWWYDMLPNNTQSRGHASWPRVQFFRRRCRSTISRLVNDVLLSTWH